MAEIGVLAGDGIGQEVMPEGLRALEAVARRHGLTLRFAHFDWGCDHHARTGRMMPEDGLARLASLDAIFLGAIGWPTVSDVESLWTLLMPIRRGFQQYVNLRPVRRFEGLPTPLAAPGAIDFVIVRENTEGEYSEIGGRHQPGTDQEAAVQTAVFTRHGCDRVMRYAFALARGRQRRLTSATKSNGIIHTLPFWDERFRAIAADYPDVATEQYHIDILAAHLVRRPHSFDVSRGLEPVR
jgi:tartrate dehydrogenase/decarboxylase/D-malate dehydrogenase